MDAPRPADRSADDVDEAVFDVVESIPPGRVSTYGAVGRLVGVGPRRVARALAGGGGAGPWSRGGGRAAAGGTGRPERRGLAGRGRLTDPARPVVPRSRRNRDGPPGLSYP